MWEYPFVFLLGSLLYGITELLWRGWTHWTMLLCGGLCFSLMYQISIWNLSLCRKWILSTAQIITLEYFFGCLLNLHLKMQIWDYSDQPFQLSGQICLLFSLFWFLLSIPGTALCTRLHKWLHRSNR